ncbi:MAG: hypothetical protein JO060_00330, partial [Candidatus Eremiobacteraeota bacterium]|nr:hypothetical protein [Candidatus Eremiobacteraeota bacterium]
ARSVDRALGWWVLPDQGQIWIALAIGAALGVINNFIRRPAPTAVKAPTA